MNYWQTVPSDYRSRLEELAQTLLACRDAFHKTADTFHWEPAPGSGAAAAAMSLPSPDPAIADPTGETGHRLIAEVLQIFLFTATSHMGGMASLLCSAEVVSSPSLLLRAVIENCAHATWVLGKDHDEPAEDRLARVYLEELKSAEEAKTNAGRLRGKEDPTYKRTEAAYRRLKTDIVARFPGATPAELGKGLLHGQQFPRLEDAVKWMYSLTAKFGGTISETTASGLYGLLSNLTHPTLYPGREQRIWVKDPTTGHNVAQVRVTIESVEYDVRAALAAFYNAINYVTSYFGWPEPALRSLESKIETAIPGFFR